MESETRETAERLNAILESAVDGILAIDEHGKILSVNAAALSLFGYSREELMGGPIEQLMPQPFSDEHDRYIHQYIATGDPKIIGIGREVIGLRKDATEFPLYLAVSEGADHGHRIFTGILRDLTKIRQTEERAKAAEQLASLSVITAGIAHDIGTPMNVILGYADMLRESLEDPKDRRRAEVISDQVRRVTDLLQTLLNIARPRETLRSAVRIEKILDHALEFFSDRLEKGGIEVERYYAELPELSGDRDRLEQMLLNLINNAADSMSEGGKLTVVAEPDGPDWIVVSISDSGHGMDAETRAQIFDPFYSTKKRGKGTGLGLVVAKTIVLDHRGTISCESEVDKGTRFIVRLPVT